MHKFEIDTERKKVSLVVLLKGEPSAIEVDISDYEIRYQESSGFFCAKSVTTNREWLTAILTNVLVEHSVEIKPEKLSLIEKILG